MTFFGIESYEPERGVKLQKMQCFYSNPMHLTVAKLS